MERLQQTILIVVVSIQSLAVTSSTKFTTVRFGNVLGSNGSDLHAPEQAELILKDLTEVVRGV